MAGNEEEAMELSGESGLVSNLHQFSFDVSWSHHERDPSPQQIRRRPLLSPSRLKMSTPISRDWKSLTTTPRYSQILSPVEIQRSNTVKVSQTTPFRTDSFVERRQSFSPMELDHSEASFEVDRQATKPRKRQSDFCVTYDMRKEQKALTPLKRVTEYNTEYDTESLLGDGKKTKTPTRKITEYIYNTANESLLGDEKPTRTPRRMFTEYDTANENLLGDRKTTKTPRRKMTQNETNNNNYKDGSDLEDSVFYRSNDSSCLDHNGYPERGKSKLKKKPSRKSMDKREKKSSHILLTLMVLVSVGIAGYFLFQAGSCSVFDVDIVKLKHKLEDNVFGQRIAVNTVVTELEKFGQAVKQGSYHRTLVMSFHGWTGVGKNFISRFIAESFYNAKITLFSIPWHFPHESSNEDESRKLQKKVKSWIMGNITKCGVNVFIFDEMDKAKKDFLAGLESAMEELISQETTLAESSVKSPIIVMLFISNSKAVQVNQYLFSQIGEDRDREGINIDEFSFIFDKTTNDWYTSMKEKNLLNTFVPFLPLAESHVRQCIVKDFIHKGRDPSERLIEAVMDELSFFDMGGHYGQMSLTGCKRVHDKVDLHIDD